MSRSESSQEVKVPTEDEDVPQQEEETSKLNDDNVDEDKENNDIVKRVLQVNEAVVKEPTMVPGSNDGKLCVISYHFVRHSHLWL